MATTTADNIQIIGGVDTHQDLHTAAVVSHDGTVLGTESFLHHPSRPATVSTRAKNGGNPQIPDKPSPWLTRWAHRHLPRCFASRNASATRSSGGSLLWTTGTTAQRWAESHQVVHFYAGQWCTFTPALTARDLSGEDIVRLILDGTGVKARLDGRVLSIPLLVVLGVRRDGQKVLLAVKNMGGETEAAWRHVLEDPSRPWA